MRFVTCWIAWIAAASAGFAQAGPHTVAVSAGVIDVSLLRAAVPGQSDPSLPTTGIGGNALGITLGVDIGASRHVGLAVEFNASSDASDHQQATNYQRRFLHHDTLLSVYARFRLRSEDRVRFDAVAGASLAHSDMRVATSVLVFDPSQRYGPFSDYERWPFGHHSPAISAGVDVPIGRGRVTFVPTFRLHYIFRDIDTQEQIGLGKWSLRPGIGIHVGL